MMPPGRAQRAAGAYAGALTFRGLETTAGRAQRARGCPSPHADPLHTHD